MTSTFPSGPILIAAPKPVTPSLTSGEAFFSLLHADDERDRERTAPWQAALGQFFPDFCGQFVQHFLGNRIA